MRRGKIRGHNTGFKSCGYEPGTSVTGQTGRRSRVLPMCPVAHSAAEAQETNSYCVPGFPLTAPRSIPCSGAGRPGAPGAGCTQTPRRRTWSRSEDEPWRTPIRTRVLAGVALLLSTAGCHGVEGCLFAMQDLQVLERPLPMDYPASSPEPNRVIQVLPASSLVPFTGGSSKGFSRLRSPYRHKRWIHPVRLEGVARSLGQLHRSKAGSPVAVQRAVRPGPLDSADIASRAVTGA